MMRRSPLALIFFTVFLDLIGFGIVLPLLPGFAADYGASEWQIGLLMASYSLMQFVFAPIWGALSDRVGRKPVLLFSLGGSAASYMLFAAAPSLPVLFIARLAAGAMAANISTAQAYVADVTTEERRAQGMGLIGAAFGLGFVFGPALAGLLSGGTTQEAQWRVGVAAALLSAIDLLLMAFILPESLTREKRAGQPRRWPRLESMKLVIADPRLAPPILVFFLATVAWSSLEPTLVRLLSTEFSFERPQIGYLFAGFGLLAAILMGGVTGRLAARVGEVRMVRAGALFLTIGLVSVALAHSLASLYGALLLLAVGQAALVPAVQSIISRTAAAGAQGGTLGVSQGFSSLARVIGPAMGGWLFGLMPAAAFLSAGLVVAVALGIAITHLKQPAVEGSPA